LPGAFFVRFERFLVRANLVALAALLVLLITIAGFGIAEYTRSDDRYSEQFVRSTEPRGEILKGPQGKITLYARQDSDSEAQRDIRFVDMQRALLHNKVMDSLGESVVIDGPDAQTDAAEVSHDQLARV